MTMTIIMKIKVSEPQTSLAIDLLTRDIIIYCRC